MSFKTICTMAATATFVIIGAPDADAGKAKFQRTKPHANVGTIGHVDHSKTLVRQQHQVRMRHGKTLANSSVGRRINTKLEGGRRTPFFAGYRPQFYFRTTDVTGRPGQGAASGLATEAGTSGRAISIKPRLFLLDEPN